jgi:Xaa-Pro aminopeptidase
MRRGSHAVRSDAVIERIGSINRLFWNSAKYQWLQIGPGMCGSLETSYMAAQGAYAPGPYNIEDSFVITEDGYDRFTTVPSTLVWDGSLPAR